MMATSVHDPGDDRPYLGLRSYEERDAGRFFGREEQIEELVRMVRRRSLTVLFGVSGIGKSSLIQAGLFPVLRADSYLPILVRLDFSGAEHDLGAQVRHAIACELEARQVEAPAPPAGVSLWRYFATTPLWSARNRLLIPLLVFDQFEEMFTLGRGFAQQADGLMAELAELVERRPTVTELAELIDLGDAAPDLDFVCPEPRVMLSVREDFLAHLEDTRRNLPSLATNRYRLTRMRGTQALRAVQQPSAGTVSDETARRIVEFVAAGGESPSAPSRSSLELLEVEPTLLSLVCDELDRRRREQHLKEISEELIARQGGRIVERFYDRAFEGLPDAMRSLVEEKLVTRDGCRTTMALAAAIELPGVTDEGIARLIDRRVLRTETRFGAAHIELIHDRLTKVASEGHARRRERRRVLRDRVITIALIAIPLTVIGLILLGFNWLLQRDKANANALGQHTIAIESATLRRDEGREALMRGDPVHALELLKRAADRWGQAKVEPSPASDSWVSERELLTKRALLAVAGRAAVDHGSDLACVRLHDRNTLITCGRDGSVRRWSPIHAGGAAPRAIATSPTSSPIQLALPSRGAAWALLVRDGGGVEVAAADHDQLSQFGAHTATGGQAQGATGTQLLRIVLADAVHATPAAPSQSVRWRACIAPDDALFAVWTPDMPGIRAWLDGKRASVLPFDDIVEASHVRCLGRGKLLIALSSPDRSRDDLAVVELRDPRRVTLLKLPRASQITQLSGSADGRVVVAAAVPAGRSSGGAHDVYLWNVGDDPVTLGTPRGNIETLAVSDDGNQVLATVHLSAGRTLVAVWRVRDGSLAFAVPRTAAIAQWLPDGKGLAIASSNRTVEAWDVASQRLVATARLDDEIDLARVDVDAGLLDFAGRFPSYAVAFGRGHIARVALLEAPHADAPEPAPDWGDRVWLSAAEDLGLWAVSKTAKDAGGKRPPGVPHMTVDIRRDGSLVLLRAGVVAAKVLDSQPSPAVVAEVAPPTAASESPIRVAVLRRDGTVTIHGSGLSVVARPVARLGDRPVVRGAHAIRWSARRELITLERGRVRIWSEDGELLGEVETAADDAQLAADGPLRAVSVPRGYSGAALSIAADAHPPHMLPPLWTCDRAACTAWDIGAQAVRARLAIAQAAGTVRLSPGGRFVVDQRDAKYLLPAIPSEPSVAPASAIESLAYFDAQHTVSTSALGRVYVASATGVPTSAATTAPPASGGKGQLATALQGMLLAGAPTDHAAARQSLWERTAPIRAIRWIDDARLAVVNAAFEVGVVDAMPDASGAAPGGRIAGQFTGARAAGSAATFSPAGDRVAMLSPSGDIVVIPRNGDATVTYRTDGAAVRAILLPDSTSKVIVASTCDGLLLWKRPEDRPSLWYGHYRSVLLARDGLHVIALRYDDAVAELIQVDPLAGRLHAQVTVPAIAIAIDDRPDRFAVARRQAGAIEIAICTWSPVDDRPPECSPVHAAPSEVERLALVPGGNRVWVPEAHHWLHAGDGPRGPIRAHARECAFAGDGKRAACVFHGEGDPYIQLFGIPGGNSIGGPAPLPGHRAPDAVIAGTGHSDGRIVLGVVSDGVTWTRVWDSPDTTDIKDAKGRIAEPRVLAIPGAQRLRVINDDPDALWSLSDDGRLQRWQVSTGKLAGERDGARLLDVAASPSDVRLAVSAPGGIVVQRVPGPSQVLASSSGVTLARFVSPNSVIGVVRSGDQDIVAIWREAEYEVLEPGSSNRVKALTPIDPESAIGAHMLAATGRADGTLELWTRSGSPKVHSAQGHGSAIRQIVAGPTWLATSADDGTVSVWRFDTRPEQDRIDESDHDRLVELVRLNEGRGPGAPAIAFSPSTREPALAIGQRNGDVEVMTLGKPMPDTTKDVIAGALTRR